MLKRSASLQNGNLLYASIPCKRTVNQIFSFIYQELLYKRKDWVGGAGVSCASSIPWPTRLANGGWGASPLRLKPRIGLLAIRLDISESHVTQGHPAAAEVVNETLF